MVVAQLAERSLPIPEVNFSNLVIGKIFVYLLNVEKTKIKRGRECPIATLENFCDFDSWGIGGELVQWSARYPSYLTVRDQIPLK